MPRVFISYSTSDRDIVDPLKEALTRAGIDVWLDHERLVPGTPNWQEAVREGIHKADVLIYIASPTAARSQYVIHEIEIAHGEGKRVIPFWLRGEKWYDCVPMGMISAQFIDGRGDQNDAGRARLFDALASKGRDKNVESATPVPLPSTTAVTKDASTALEPIDSSLGAMSTPLPKSTPVPYGPVAPMLSRDRAPSSEKRPKPRRPMSDKVIVTESSPKPTRSSQSLTARPLDTALTESATSAMSVSSQGSAAPQAQHVAIPGASPLRRAFPGQEALTLIEQRPPKASTPPKYSAPTVSRRRLLIASAMGAALIGVGGGSAWLAHSRSGGVSRWSYDASNNHAFVLTALNKSVLVTKETDYPLYALDANTGSQLWTYADGRVQIATAANGVVYAGVDGASTPGLVALDSNTGTQRWIYQTADTITTFPAVTSELIYVGSGDNSSIYAIDVNSGTGRWIHQVSQAGNVSIVSLAVANGVVSATASNGYLYVLNAHTGELQWSYQAGSSVGTVAMTNETIYICVNDVYLIALDAKSGSQRWRFKSAGRIADAPVVANGMVYVTAQDIYLYALDASHGSVRWSYQTNGLRLSTSAIANAAIYVGWQDPYANIGRLIALDAKSGANRWSYQAYGSVSSVVAADGVVYVEVDIDVGSSIYAING